MTNKKQKYNTVTAILATTFILYVLWVFKYNNADFSLLSNGITDFIKKVTDAISKFKLSI